MSGDLPLRGVCVAVTRASDQAGELSSKLKERGAQVVEIPVLRVVPPTSYEILDRSLGDLSGFDLVLFTSVNGARAVGERMSHLGLNPRIWQGANCGAVGVATARALTRLGIEPRWVPPRFQAEALLDFLPEEVVEGRSVLVIRAEEGREELVTGLRKRGARVILAPAYRVVLNEAGGEMAASLPRIQCDWVVFASGSAVRHLHELLGDSFHSTLAGIRIATLGPITSEACRRAGLPVHLEAPVASLDSLVDSLAKASSIPAAFASPLSQE